MSSACMIASWSQIFTTDKYMGNELWRWLGLFGLLLGSLVAGKVLSFLLHRQTDRLDAAGRTPVLSGLLKSLTGPASVLLVTAALYLSGTFIYFAEKTVAPDGTETTSLRLLVLLPVWTRICQAMGSLAVAWFLFRLVDVAEYFLRKLTSRTQTSLDDQLVPLIRKTLRVFVVIVAFLFIAQNIFEWQIGAMLAGLGIGGLAIALAAKDAMSNLFGSVTIFLDRPFLMGDRIKMAGQDGTVEEVGFRSTRIRTLEGHQVIIPNAMVANEPVENVGRRPSLRRILNVTVTYDTPPDKLQLGVDILRQMLQDRMDRFHPDFPPRVFFSDFNDCSLNIIVYYWFAPPDWWEYMAFSHEFNMELLRRFNEEGIEFAFPTRTQYIKQDSPLAFTIRQDGMDGCEAAN